MNERDFQPGFPGRFVRNLEGRLTFAPEPLYPFIKLTPQIQHLLTEVHVTLGRLDGMTRLLPDPRILIRSFVRREAQLSSYIENTFAPYDELSEADRVATAHGRRGNRAPVSESAIETLNAERAILAGVEAVLQKGRPVNNVLIKGLHEILLTGVRGHGCRGEFREEKQVYIGKEELGADAARFIPPAGHLVRDLMQDFERAWHAGDELFGLIRLALLHYQFETIHPFEDGNGRLGRMLTLLGLCSYGLLTTPVLNASLHFERNRQQYYDSLLRVSTHGDWTGWIEFFLQGLHVAAVESSNKLTELLALQKSYHDLIRSARNSALLLTLIDHLFIRPVMTVPEAARIMRVTQPAASQSVSKLVAHGILRVREAGKPTIYIASTLLKALNPEPTRRR